MIVSRRFGLIKAFMLYIVLLHFPVYNKEGKVVTTSVANMDLHDIARVAKTYGVRGYYVVNPIAQQRRFAQEIVSHWQTGLGAQYNSSRRQAFELIRIRKDLDEVLTDIKRETGSKPKTIATGAGLKENTLKCSQLKKMVRKDESPFVILFGSGYGLAKDVIDATDFKLEPITGRGSYNHLSVRSAVAIILDRISH